MNQHNYDFIPPYQQPEVVDVPFERFKDLWHNKDYRTSFLTYITLFILVVVYPVISLVGDPSMLKDIDQNQGILIFMLVATIIMLWVIFLIAYVATYLEKTMLIGVGFVKLRGKDFLWAIGFLVAANLLLFIIAAGLDLIGLSMPEELNNLIPTGTGGRIIWVIVSFTAGICEETLFRGYLMTRIRLLFKLNSWVIPVIISSIAFGVCHAYQGVPGLIVLSLYGALFSLLYIKTKSIWPGIIAHSIQDLWAMVYYIILEQMGM